MSLRRRLVVSDPQAIHAERFAGHDLNRDNLSVFLRHVPGVLEASIGHALIADALELGYAETVRSYLRVIATAYT